MEPDRLSRFQGCLVGLAVADAFGMPVEGWTRKQIQQKFGVLDDMVDGWLPAGFTTDDTAQMLCVAESLAMLDGFDADDIAKRLMDWYLYNPIGIGLHTKRVLSVIAQGKDWREAVEQVENEDSPLTAGNGSLMRCAPVGLRYYRDIGGLLEFSHELSRLTHPNPLCRASCAFFNAVLSRVVRGWDKRDAVSFAMEVMAHAPHELLESITTYKTAHEPNVSGFVLDTLTCALWGWWNYDDYKSSLIAVVNLGGDTDTNAAVCGALMGAQLGLEAIPNLWREKVTVIPKCIELATKIYEKTECDF